MHPSHPGTKGRLTPHAPQPPWHGTWHVPLYLPRFWCCCALAAGVLCCQTKIRMSHAVVSNKDPHESCRCGWCACVVRVEGGRCIPCCVDCVEERGWGWMVVGWWCVCVWGDGKDLSWEFVQCSCCIKLQVAMQHSTPETSSQYNGSTCAPKKQIYEFRNKMLPDFPGN